MLGTTTIKSIAESKNLKIQRQAMYAYQDLAMAERVEIHFPRAINKSVALAGVYSKCVCPSRVYEVATPRNVLDSVNLVYGRVAERVEIHSPRAINKSVALAIK
ncbi:hypothetical protein [uncultured Helicobacter sp.]|uniref:hypothetical protein n=1 Tax=uncultured Helicobacter sp. TaxID=175537 RepID=UPI00374E3879